MQKGIIKFKNAPTIISTYSVVGKKEHEGPLGDFFDEYDTDNKFNMKSWEKAEGEMQKRAFLGALKRAKLNDSDIDALFSGDLLNQCVGSSYGLLEFDIPYVGLYGACSTCAEGIALASCLVSSGSFDTCASVTSSHFCSSERQFRFPLEYGGQRTPTSQWTVTGAGAFIIGSGGKIEIPEIMLGKTIEMGISDINNMGAAMAPSVVDTVIRYFGESELSPSDFDLIVTGDLGFEGSEILKELLYKKGYDIRKNHIDCGLIIFDRSKQDVHAGGSGCGCSASVLSSTILKNLENGAIKDILFIGTGALMSPMTLFQGEAIPGIAHLIRLRAKE